MVIYFANRKGKVIDSAATDLPDDRSIIEDVLTDELDNGVKIFTCVLKSSERLKQSAVAGNYVLAYGSLFQITLSTFDVLEDTLELYCEDAGLDLINRICAPVTASTRSLSNSSGTLGWLQMILGTSSGWNFNLNIKNSQKYYEFTSEGNALERLQEILELYDAEMFFTYEIDGFEWVSRTLNIVSTRGNHTRFHQLRMDEDVINITQEESVESLATVWKMYGKDKSGNTKPLEKLEGYSSATKTFPAGSGREHSFTVVGSEVRCTEAISKWKSKLDTDGRIVQNIYTSYKRADYCIAYGVHYLDYYAEPIYTYEVEFRKLPEDSECGDYVYITDDKNDIYISARIITLERSETDGYVKATLGSFARVKGSKAEYSGGNDINVYMVHITSSQGLVGKSSLSTVLTVTVNQNGQTITDSSGLDEGQALAWYEDGVLVPSSDARISNNGFTFSTGTLSAGHTYKCKLEVS